MPFAATWMALEIVILNEVSQTKKEKYITFLISRILKEMIQMNLFTKQKQIHRLGEQTHGCWGKGWEEGIGGLGWTLLYLKYTLLYLKWIINKDLLYSMRNSAQCCLTAWMGENVYTNMYGWVPLLSIWNYHNIVNWLYSNTKLKRFF